MAGWPIDSKKRLIVFIESVGRYLPINISRTKVEPVYEVENENEKLSVKITENEH